MVVVTVAFGITAVAGVVATVGVSPAGAASALAPQCPPECGFVAAGDPVLVHYMVANPGPGWLALPADSVQPYVDSLQGNLTRVGGRGSAPTWPRPTGCG